MSIRYKDAGVDKEAGYEEVKRIKKWIDETKTEGVLSGIGGFSGLFRPDIRSMKEPVLVSGTDGVGTKLMLAFETGIHDTVGIDLVAMCVNDIICQGAEPLFFLDYIATGKLVPEKAEKIVKGVAEGCKRASCALIGGETAEMPGMYGEDEYDLAGFAVGIVDREDIVTGENIAAGDVLMGLPSSGVHSNGFSLVRKIIRDRDLDLDAVYFGEKPLGEALLEPTVIYADTVKKLRETIDIKGMAHITGGGIPENIPRMLPEGLDYEIEKREAPEMFRFIQEVGGIAEDEMENTFNMGTGFVFCVDKDAVKDVQSLVPEVFVAGRVI